MSKHRSLEDHWFDVIGPLEMLVPILAGALKFNPPGLVDSSPEAEVLNDYGREFTRFVYRVVRDAHKAALSAWGDLPSKNARHKEFIGRAKAVESRLTLILLLCRGLMETDLPIGVSADEGLRLLQELVEEAFDMANAMDPHRSARRAS